MKLPRFPVHTFGRWYCRMVCREEYGKQKNTVMNERPVELRFVFEHLSKSCPSTVLDVGTGRSSLPHLMSLCGYEVTAIDNVDDYWRRGLFNRHFLVTRDDITSPAISGQFDFITCISVLEHIRDHNAAVRSMLSLLAPGGKLAITCPYNENTYVGNVYSLPDAGYGKNFPYICQAFSRREVNGWLETGDAELIEQEYWRFFSGEFWTVGDRICPPQEVSKRERHQITCMLFRKNR